MDLWECKKGCFSRFYTKTRISGSRMLNDGNFSWFVYIKESTLFFDHK